MKILTILTIAAIAVNINVANADTCTDSSGAILTGVNEHNYCLGTKDMNWWTAYAWCEGQGRHLATMYELCPDWDGSTGTYKCANISVPEYSSNSNIAFWSSTASGDRRGFYAFATQGGRIDTDVRNSVRKAICY